MGWAETVYIGIGSNVGRRLYYLAQAIRDLSSIAADGRVQCSPIYETDPVGYLDQPPFLNMVAAIDVEINPFAVLSTLHNIEHTAGRTRDLRYGPRTLDLDILLYGHRAINNTDLEIPHPRLSERAFALQPLMDLAPELCLPDGTHVSQLVSGVAERGGVHYVGRFW